MEFYCIGTSITSVSQEETEHIKRQWIGGGSSHEYTLLSTDFEILYF
jgi:hypothetical protein